MILPDRSHGKFKLQTRSRYLHHHVPRKPGNRK